MKIQRIYSGAPWEKAFGYCRLVKVGAVIEISGTTAVDEVGHVAAKGFRAQTDFILNKIETALQEVGASRQHITRTRIFTTDISSWQEIGAAHAAFFAGCEPSSSLLQIDNLINPDLKIEIEASAYLPAAE